MASLEKCLLCRDDPVPGPSVVVKKGRQTLIDVSMKINDGLANEFQAEELILHVACRKRYTHPTTVAKLLSMKAGNEDETPPPRLRSSESVFDLKRDCLFCGEEANIIKEKKRDEMHRRVIHEVTTLPFKDKVIQQSFTRNDQWGETVRARAMSVSDLVAAESKYHHACHAKFFSGGSLEPGELSRGRPEDRLKAELFLNVCKFLDDSDECQFSLAELISIMNNNVAGSEDTVYSGKHLKEKLKAHYGDRITVTQLPGKSAIVNFTDSAHTILHDNWYTDRKKSENDEKMRIIETAASIIREDIQKAVYNTGEYQPYSAEALISDEGTPKSLQRFLAKIVSSKNSVSNSVERKRQAISEAIVSACRPRSYIPPLLLGIGVYMHRHFASRQLVDLLSNFGFSVSYNEVQRFEHSVIDPGEKPLPEDGYIQYVFDNADFNIKTLTGHGTFHNMGGIRCLTPKSSATSLSKPIQRVMSPPSADEIAKCGRFPVSWYKKPDQSGLKHVPVVDLGAPNLDISAHLAVDRLWMSGVWAGVPSPPSWHGYRRSSTDHGDINFATTKIDALPFINLDPSNLSSIYSALRFASEECRKHGQQVAMVTFDQPLYIKAADIVASQEGELSNIVVRLGGFHLLMSFMGSVGFIMAGSGLDEIWAQVYAKGSVVQMLTGHAYSRGLRAHFLTQLALVTLLLRNTNLSQEVREELRTLHTNYMDNQISSLQVSESKSVISLCEALEKTAEDASAQSRTAKLWLQYIRQVDLMRMYIRAERSGDWQLHLYCVQKMLPHFHAAGHYNYAKSAHLYVQQMKDISSKLPEDEYEKFNSLGYFTIRRSDAFWSGVWSDMAIEQDLMRSLKVQGGLTRGRGLTESTLARFVLSFPGCLELCEAVEEVSGVGGGTSEQHVELRDSRRKADNRDLLKMISWLELHSPFGTTCESDSDGTALRSLSSGIIADSTVNCDLAEEVGKAAMEKMMGNNFANVKLKRNDRVKPLSSVSTSIVIRGEQVHISTNQLFMRIACVMKSEHDLQEHLKFELSATPPALFDDISMRKTSKSSLTSVMNSVEPRDDHFNRDGAVVVIDGGYLLHAVVWPRPATYAQVCDAYVRYVQSRYKVPTTIVFDGYDAPNSTKMAEQQRRAAKRTSPDIAFEASTLTTTTQADFLANAHNKTRFIGLLTDRLQEEGICVEVAVADADSLVVSCALRGNTRHVTVVANDTDILVMLIARCIDTDIKVLHPATTGRPGKLFDVSEIQSAYPSMKSSILFLHAFTGCDTTSAIFRIGKLKGWKLLKDDEALRSVIHIFSHPDAKKQEVVNAGEKFMMYLYGGKKNTTYKDLDEMRVHFYSRAVAKQPLSSLLDLATLPPTSAACKQHSLRAYHQVQAWLGKDIDATKWGWKCVNNVLQPVPTELPPAPDSLLNLVACNCKQCGGRCECRRSGLSCSHMCRQCAGVSCTNSSQHGEPEIEDEDDM